MSASVRVESGIAAGTSYWIDRPVLRVGSDPQCEISVPSADLPAHALTLEFRGGAYKVYNRGSVPIFLGNTAVQPGAVGAWNDGDVATLPGDVRLLLTFDGDPRPAPRPDSRTDDGFDEPQIAAGEAANPATPEAAQKAKSKSTMQLLVIGLCVAAGGLLLMMSGDTEAPSEDRPSFSQIVETSLKKDNNIRTLVQKLQYAESFIVRGNDDVARQQFSELRDQLTRQMDSLSADDQKDAKSIQDYVETRLSQLQ